MHLELFGHQMRHNSIVSRHFVFLSKVASKHLTPVELNLSHSFVGT